METLHDYLFKHMEEFIDYNDEFYFLETTTPETRMKTLMSMEPIDVFYFRHRLEILTIANTS